MERNNLRLRRRTNLTTLSDDVLVDRALAFMRFLQENKPTMNRDKTILMDETAIYFEGPRNRTVDEVGRRHVIIRSAGFASMRITAALAVTASGKKLPPCLIWERKTRGPLERLGGCYWLDWHFPSVTQSEGQWVVWDSMRAHIGKISIKMTVIPGGLTPYLQAGDVGIFKSFKDNMSVLIDAWKRSDQVSYTRGGNPRPPPIETIVAWVATADWFISGHDVYGARFRQAWTGATGDEQTAGGYDSGEGSVDELLDAFDEVWIEDQSLHLLQLA
ncbi:hypothetical protein PHYSODRAFT_309400 [Phytophthora sojae]|uniref:DDE-1 domain-containing protein n=1 Tax=Phytophthora sojae (strain P6497) TaxID=1094619 RepID=G4YMF5_PHYSP|nr:hypothetical protein PHYSODRAFT_309400 [Phytophthora sojae]EGZ28581.1 hypothetical protein PHYSODRAFT_309400 [Phytophthora sojae]|eukprot:XP_009515856.1 hypothetical protein PHYSODRAFT_309400 [Phytophthora sojae]